MPEPDFIPKNWTWLAEIGFVILVAFVLSFLVKKGLDFFKTHKKVRRILKFPLQLAIWGFTLAHIVDVASSHFGYDFIAEKARPFKGAFVAACVGWICLRWVKETFRTLAMKTEKLGVATGTIYALSKLSSFVLSILILLVIFQIFGFDVLPLLTFGGIGVAGIAFAAQDMIANFFGGAMLHFTRIFSIDDLIVIPSMNNFNGQVKEIGWYTTMVQDYERRPVYIPNALFSKSQVINESRRSHRRIRETITLGYDDLPVVEAIVDELKKRIGAHPDVDETQSFSISLNEYADHGINIFIYCLSKHKNFLKFQESKQDILVMIKEIVEKHGAEFCYPTQQVNLRQV